MQTILETADWQQELRDSVTDAAELFRLLKLPMTAPYFKNISTFPLRVPRDFVARMEPGNPEDPLLLQVLPVGQEAVITTGYSNDPLNEHTANTLPGLLHKYEGRVLIIVTAGCAVNCRYCFRRHFPYQENTLSAQHLEKILHYLADRPNIFEVILSGGDPLILKDASLRKLIEGFHNIPHLKYLRLHTRLPIVIPARITTEFIEILTSTHLKTALVLHCNHPNEISTSVGVALKKLHGYPIQLLNQSVLLKSINDDAQVLMQLSHTLYENGVMPYYLHLLDKVQNAAHFAVSEARGGEIMRRLREQLPGYLVPKFVKEIANEKYKVPISY